MKLLRVFFLLALSAAGPLRAVEPLAFTVKLETVLKQDDGAFLWFHPRATAIPGGVVMTIQKHLKISDYYSGLHFMTRGGLDGAWHGPVLPPELDWQQQPDGVTVSVADVTPGYNTQQHWLAHSDGLFLIYTRRGANNDHIVRNRAPLFMAQVDPESLQIIRRTEQVVVPERGAELGNFGASALSADESWVTVSEGMFMPDSKARGAEGATFVARIRWAKPNRLVAPPTSLSSPPSNPARTARPK